MKDEQELISPKAILEECNKFKGTYFEYKVSKIILRPEDYPKFLKNGGVEPEVVCYNKKYQSIFIKHKDKPIIEIRSDVSRSHILFKRTKKRRMYKQNENNRK